MRWIFHKIKKVIIWLKAAKPNPNLRHLKEEITAYYRHSDRMDDEELRDAAAFVEANGLCVFPGPFSKKYNEAMAAAVEVFHDAACDLSYVLHEGRRLYFVRGWSDRTIRHAYIGLCMEQDSESPHCYRQPDFATAAEDTLFDIGCAEAMSSLAAVERVKALFLFEGDPKWSEPLRHTFAPWSDKVTIIEKFVSDTDTDRTVSIGNVIREAHITGNLLLKLDVEGMERAVLAGMSEVLKSWPDEIRAVICTYHRHDDYADLSALMRSVGFEVVPSKGYMLFLYDPDRLRPPYFRKGMIRCTKNGHCSDTP